MQRAQRTRSNHALEYAIWLANDAGGLPVIVGFGLMDDYPEANERHYAFMLEGLRDVARNLRQRGIAFVVRRGSPPEAALRLSQDAAFAVCDGGYLRHERAWRDTFAERAPCSVVEVETDVAVPVDFVSRKREVGARSLRPKLHRAMDEFLWTVPPGTVRANLSVASDVDVEEVDRVLAALRIDRTVRRVSAFHGGEEQAAQRLDRFVTVKLARYRETRGEPAARSTSTLSPYLHFGQISPVEIMWAVRAAGGGAKFIEEVIVRRELAFNFVRHEPNYDSYAALPDWAKATLEKHAGDKRPTRYTPRQLEAAETHDRYWNAAMREMRSTGYMHNTMRMYWGKKILEWSASPRAAYRTTLHLNNKWLLDGRDPNSFANVGWIFGLHDRPWPERPIFGTVRYMAASGLERKFDIDAYVHRYGSEESA
jgi:deoxyribodipyrimidine photo-lyase